MDRKTITDLYIRICKDSGHKLDAIAAMQLTANILDIAPLEVAYAFPSIFVAQDIAKGLR